jgi:hypothetical protein
LCALKHINVTKVRLGQGNLVRSDFFFG